MSSCFSGARAARRRSRAIISAAAAMTAAAALASPAGAVVNGSHVVAVLPDSQGLELSGYPLNDTLNIHVIRNGITIGSATGVTTPDRKAPNTGDLNIAGGAPPCWTGSTPQILPGDEVTVDDGGVGLDSMIVQNVGATSLERDPVTHDILVHGFAIAPGGGEYDPVTFAANVQARITIAAGSLFSNGKNTLRAGGGKFDGTIAYDAPTANDPNPVTWTADLPMSDFDAQLALGSKDFEGVYTVGLSEVTIGRQPPSASGCPAPAADSVTSFDRSAVNVSNVATPMTISGVAEPGATNVSVVLSDTKGNTVTFPNVTPSGGSWSTAALDVSGLLDGTLTATPTFTVTGQPDFVGATLTIAKDVVAPTAPIASPPGGTYTSTKSVTLGDDDATAAVHYTTVGTKPAAASPVFGVSPITVDHSMTVRAIAMDAAGNVSPEATFAYTITAPTAPTGGGGGGASPVSSGGLTIIQVVPGLQIQPVAPRGGVAGNRLTSPARPAVSGLRVSVAKGHALRVSMQVGSGASVVRFQVFRAKSGRASGRALTSLSRVATGRTFSGTLRGAALRRLRAGRYVLVAQAGASGSALGAAARASFTLR
jgi:Chitobiase/beta-hexosaminidase C-terminal domain